MTILELKAQAYDTLAQIQYLQKQLEDTWWGKAFYKTIDKTIEEMKPTGIRIDNSLETIDELS